MEEKIHKLLRGQHFKAGRIYTAGDLVPLTAQEAKAFENKFELVPQPAPAEPPAETSKGKIGKSKIGKANTEEPKGDGDGDGDPGMGEGEGGE